MRSLSTEDDRVAGKGAIRLSFFNIDSDGIAGKKSCGNLQN